MYHKCSESAELRDLLQSLLTSHFTNAAPRFERWANIDRALKAYKQRSKEENNQTTTGVSQQRLDASKQGNDFIDDIHIPLLNFVCEMYNAQLADILFSRARIHELSARKGVLGEVAERLNEWLDAADRIFGNTEQLMVTLKHASKYNQGWTALSWEKRTTKRVDMTDGGSRYVKDHVQMEGVKFSAISPYRMILDPNVAPDNVPAMRFIGFLEPASGMDLLREYGEELDLSEATPAWLWPNAPQQDAYLRRIFPTVPGNDQYTRVELYVDLVPKKYGLSDNTKPEVWHFVMIGYDKILVAEPANVPVGKYPFESAVPHGDGIDTNPVGTIELVQDMCAEYTWLHSSRMAAVRNDLSGTLLVNERLVNLQDVYDIDPHRGGNIVRYTDLATMMPGSAKEALVQLQFSHDTKNYSSDAAQLFEMIKVISGIVDMISGVTNDPSSRRTAEEIARATDNASKRFRLIASRLHYKWLKNLGERALLITQMMAENDIEITSRTGEQVTLKWRDIVIPLDINIGSGYMMRDPQQVARSWQGIISMIMQNDDLRRIFKLVSVTEEYGNATGIPNLRDYIDPAGAAAVVADQRAPQGAPGANSGSAPAGMGGGVPAAPAA
jgi:hypothetical protein